MNALKRGALAFFATLGLLVVAGIAVGVSTVREGPALPELNLPLTEPARDEAGSAVPDGTVTNGMWLVGTDIQPGTYRTPGPADSVLPNCYWERLRDASGEFSAIIANGNATGPVSVTVLAGEYFASSGCRSWERVS